MPGGTSTGLLPIDSAVSPQQVNRVLPIRANLLPSEITAVRNARRIRYGLIGAVILVIVLIAGWYLYAVGVKNAAVRDLATVSDQVRQAQQRKQSHRDLTDTISEQETLTAQLTTIQAKDLPWATMLDRVRAAGTRLGVTTDSVTGTLQRNETGPAGTLAITGTGKDKKTVANYVDALSRIAGVANPYLTTASQSDAGVSFTITAEITAKALCGRFTTPCTTGGK
nr:PilN domain-containing protein [uncultured Actinoplanes sp.]